MKQGDSQRLPKNFRKICFESIKLSWKLGWHCIFHGRLKWGLRRLLIPIEYWRYIEFPYTLKFITGALNQNYINMMDLSSPKFLSLIFLNNENYNIAATDIIDYYSDEYMYYRDILKKSGGFTISVQDGQSLGFANNTFQAIYSVSVLEHIQDDGDIVTMSELARVLSVGGVLIITCPVRSQYVESYVNVNETIHKTIFESLYTSSIRRRIAKLFTKPKSRKIFWSRCYDDLVIEQRLTNCSNNLNLEKKIIVSEKFPLYKIYIKLPRILKIVANLIRPFFLNQLFVVEQNTERLRRQGLQCWSSKRPAIQVMM